MKKFMQHALKRTGIGKENKKNLKGFTLVEIIVVLVILAILAAAMIPALTGYIDKAKEKTAISEARNVVMAAQTIASEAYAKDKAIVTLTDAEKTSALTLADLSAVDKDKISTVTVAGGKVTVLIYETTKGATVTYSGGEFTIS